MSEINDLRPSSLPDRAYYFALNAHAGQIDKGGKPYFEHVKRVGEAVAHLGDDHKAVGFLHDTLEDTNTDVADIIGEFGPVVTVAVIYLTRLDPAYGHRLLGYDGEKETYRDYIERVARNPIAKAVKLADLEDNMRPERIAQLPESERGVLKRYIKAKEYITTGEWPE